MERTNKQTGMQSQKLMVFVLTMALYGLATLFTELIPQFQAGIVEFSVEYFLFIPSHWQYCLILFQRPWELLPENWFSAKLCRTVRRAGRTGEISYRDSRRICGGTHGEGSLQPEDGGDCCYDWNGSSAFHGNCSGYYEGAVCC